MFIILYHLKNLKPHIVSLTKRLCLMLVLFSLLERISTSFIRMKKSYLQHMKAESPREILAQQYDLILNGYEIGAGSVRAHRGDILETTLKIMGYNHEEMLVLASVGNVYNAFQYGAPPYGDIAWGLDRLLMILEKKDSIRAVMAYPKTGSGEDYLFNAPNVLSAKKG